MVARKFKPSPIVARVPWDRREDFRASASVEAHFEAFKKEQAVWVKRMVSALPVHWRRRAEREYARLVASSEFAGNSWLRETSESARARLAIGASDAEIREAAIEAAKVAFELVAFEHSEGGGVSEIRRVLVEHCAAWGIEPAKNGGDPALLRMVCERWWLRRLRALVAKRCELAAVRGQLVCRGVWPYASQDGVERRKDQRRRNALAMSMAALRDNDTGLEVSLAEISKGTTANPVNRRNELMTRVHGCEAWADGRGLVGEFWTLTTPSRFHAQRMAGSVSEPNPAYGGADPRQAQGYLCEVWAKARSAWARRGLAVFGLRVAEPHHDATPHWHVLVFGSARDLRFARRLLAVYARRDSANEHGAKRHRFYSEKIDKKKGGAAAYLAKYVAKNIDGYGVEIDEETGKRAGAMARRCDTWAAAWRIRQFQFFGVPPVGVWRELRKMKEAAKVPAVEVARVAADAGDWCGYCEAVGGCAVPRSCRLLWAVRGGVGRVTEYGDAAALLVVALGSLGGEVKIVRGNFSIVWGAFRSSRTRVNNCTGLPGQALQGVVDLWNMPGESAGARWAQQSL